MTRADLVALLEENRFCQECAICDDTFVAFVTALHDECRSQWEANHAEHCGGLDADGTCRAFPPEIGCQYARPEVLQ